jgi:hypothetical protein
MEVDGNWFAGILPAKKARDIPPRDVHRRCRFSSHDLGKNLSNVVKEAELPG